MEVVFIKLINMSITASWLILAIILSRLLLRKAPKTILCFLWALVGFRLICPFSFKSLFSLIPSAQTVPPNIIYSQQPNIQSGIPALNQTINPIISASFAPDNFENVNALKIVMDVASIVWLIGVVAMLLYCAVSYFRLHNTVRAAMRLRENIWLCDNVKSPFILGIFRPRIYLPSDITQEQQIPVLAHEKAHMKRHDHWWKPLGFVLLSVYWFNPLVWIAYYFLCRDIELACDEKVVKDLNFDDKKAYSKALLSCSMPQKNISACPLAFGEVGVKSRIKSVLNYKRPAFWIIFVSVVATVTVSACFLTNPPNKTKKVANPLVMLESKSYVAGISASITNYDLTGDKPYIEVQWKNDNISEFGYGESFDIRYRNKNGDFVSCAKKELVFTSIGIILDANDTRTQIYYLSDFDLSKLGNYRFYLDYFSRPKIWIEFLIGGADTVNTVSQGINVNYSLSVKADGTQNIQKITSDKFRSEHYYDMYYYGLTSAKLMVNGIKTELSDAIADGSISSEELLQYADDQVKQKKIGLDIANDGGSRVYKFGSYTLIKKNTVDGDRGLYIGIPDMPYSITNERIEEPLNSSQVR